MQPNLPKTKTNKQNKTKNSSHPHRYSVPPLSTLKQKLVHLYNETANLFL